MHRPSRLLGRFRPPNFSQLEVRHGDPSIHLLQTCRLVCQEASPIVYSKNQILLPVLDLTLQFFRNCLHTPERRSWVKSVSLCFGPEDMHEHEREFVFHQICGDLTSSMAAATLIGGSGYRMLQQILADWGRARHRGYKRHLTQVIWPRKVAPLRELLALDFLDLRMDQTHGHSSCCGMVVSALSGFAPGFAKGVPSRVNISKCSLQRFCAVCRMTPDDCDCGIGYSAAVQERMKLWTQQREKGSYSVKEGFHLMDPVFQGVKGEEDDNGNW